MTDEHSAALVATVLESLASSEDLDLSGVFMIVNSNVEKLTRYLMDAEANSRFDEVQDLAGDIAGVYQVAAQHVPAEQQEILEGIAQYWEAKASAAELRSTASDADLRASTRQSLGSKPSAPAPVPYGAGSSHTSGAMARQVDKGFSRSDESQSVQKFVIKPRASDQSSGGSKS